MRHALWIAALLVLEGTAWGQTPSPYTYTPPPQQPVIRHQYSAPGLVAPIPFGGLYNVLSGNIAPQRNGQQPLTPFNSPGQPVVTP